MRTFRLPVLALSAAIMMQLTLRVSIGEAKPLPTIGSVKIGNVQYRNSETAKDAKLEQAILGELQGYSPSDSDQYIHYYYNRIDLNDDGKPEVVVYLVGSYSCGTGGCTTLILTPKGRDYRLVSELSLVRDPILVTPEKTTGWKNLVIRVSGGGMKPQYSRLRFNGRTYPGNPSVELAVAPNSTLTGIAIVANAFSAPGIVLRPR